MWRVQKIWQMSRNVCSEKRREYYVSSKLNLIRQVIIKIYIHITV